MTKNFIKLFVCLFCSCFICACVSNTSENKSAVSSLNESCFDPFYVYENFMSTKNHYAPSGWMGDVASLELDQACSTETYAGKTCMKLVYKQNGLKGWAGIYWQHPVNNWGDVKGGYDITGATKLNFWAKGAQGYEVISEVKMGGISGKFSDSDVAWLKKIKLSNSWKKYTIDLSKSDLSSISGGFCIVFSKEDNPKGCTVFLDEIKYE